MRSVYWVVLVVAACGDDGATRPDSPVAMTCQADADCGDGFCNANKCGARPMWNAPMKLGGGVPFDGSNQVGVAPRGDNLEIIYSTNRNGSSSLSIDLWHAQRQSATADFGAASVLASVSDATAIDKMPALRGDGLELLFDRSDSTGNGAIWRAMRASTSVDFDAPQMLFTVNAGSETLSGDGLRLLYLVRSTQTNTSAAYATTRASTADAFAAGTELTELGELGPGIALAPDDRYIVTVEPGTLTLQVRIVSAGSYGTPQPISELQTGAQPTISADGKTLYFSRAYNSLQNEIWYATRQ